MKAPAQPGSAYRPRLSRAEANEQIHGPARHAFTYWRVVANDHTISLFGHTVALPPLPIRTSLAGRRVALHHRMDGRLAVVYQGRVLGLLQPAHLGPPRLEEFEPAPQHLFLPQPPLPAPVLTPATPSGPPAIVPSPQPNAENPWRREGRLAFERRKQQQLQQK